MIHMNIKKKKKNVTECSWIVAFYVPHLMLSLFFKFSNNEHIFIYLEKNIHLKK